MHRARMKRLTFALLLAGCATTPKPEEKAPSRDVTAAQRINAALERLPTCGDDVAGERLEFGGACTLMACTASQCCNSCSVSPELINDDGTKTPVDFARVREVLDLGDTAYDCELRVWRAALENVRLSLKDTACVVRSKDVLATKNVKAALAALPKCEAGADVGKLVIKTTMCTRMFCNRACCNQCGWEAKFEGMSNDSQPVDAARVREVLKLGESSLDCEVKAWAGAVANESLSLGQPACVVR